MAEALAAYGDHDAELIERVTPFLALFLAVDDPIAERDRRSPARRAELRRRLDWVRSRLG